MNTNRMIGGGNNRRDLEVDEVEYPYEAVSAVWIRHSRSRRKQSIKPTINR